MRENAEISIIKYWKRKTVLLTIMKLWFLTTIEHKRTQEIEFALFKESFSKDKISFVL